MKKFIFLLISISLFASCKKEKVKHSVVYKVTVISGHPTFNVHYTTFNNTSTSQGPFTGTSWVSDKIDDFEGGDVASLKLEGQNGGSYKLFIYVDGVLHADDSMHDPYGPKTISVDIPD